MLHRIKKVNDLNQDKWIGVGGGFEQDESPEECLLREVREETGLTLTRWRYRAIITFVSDRWETEYMHLFTADRYTGEMIDCDEGVLEWVKKDVVEDLPIWEGDKLFFRLLAEDAPFFSMKLCYEGDKLVHAALNGVPLSGIPGASFPGCYSLRMTKSNHRPGSLPGGDFFFLSRLTSVSFRHQPRPPGKIHTFIQDKARDHVRNGAKIPSPE